MDYKSLYNIYADRFYEQFPNGEIAFKKNKKGFIQFNPFYQEDPSFDAIIAHIEPVGLRRNQSNQEFTGSAYTVNLSKNKQEQDGWLNVVIIKQTKQQVIAILNLTTREIESNTRHVDTFSITIKHGRVSQFMSLETGLPITFKQFLIINQTLKNASRKAASQQGAQAH